MRCHICKSPSTPVFTKKVLGKYDVSYLKCSNCGFIQTEKPYWLEESYSTGMTSLDVYAIHRNSWLSQITEKVIFKYFDHNAQFLDYGGGYGIFTRMMRDRGVNFYRQDLYAENIFSSFFDVDSLAEDKRKFEMVTCFEVLEHLDNPMHEISKMLSCSKNLFCSTKLQPNLPIHELVNWDYLGELHGQHISFYTIKSMELIAKEFGLYYYHNDDLHLFTTKKIDKFNLTDFPEKLKNKIINLIEITYTKVYQNRESIDPLQRIRKDYELIRNTLTVDKPIN